MNIKEKTVAVSIATILTTSIVYDAMAVLDDGACRSIDKATVIYQPEGNPETQTCVKVKPAPELLSRILLSFTTS